jgi:hypothetical protein
MRKHAAVNEFFNIKGVAQGDGLAAHCVSDNDENL